MKKILMIMFVAFCLFLLPIASVSADEVGEDDTDIEVTTGTAIGIDLDDILGDIIPQDVIDEATLQIDTIQSIIISIFASLTGTGIIALIVKIGLDKLLKETTAKVREAEASNQISSETANAAIVAMELFSTETTKRIENMETSFNKFITSLENTDKDINTLIEEYRARDNNIQTILEDNFDE